MMTRKEQDYLGEKSIPSNVYWGIHTQRAIENFPISSYQLNSVFVKSYAMVKKACAITNKDLSYLPDDKADAIITVCNEIIDGKWIEQIPVDALQGGAGTSTNMNINEVIANRALELLGKQKGDYAFIHPIEHVNLHQSTNDTYPTALKIASIFLLRELSSKIEKLQGSFQKKEKDFAEIVKIGKTQLKSAVPLTLGAEFSAFSGAISRDRWRTFKCEERLREVNIGGTAIGTGIGAPRKYIFLVSEKLRTITGLGLSRGENVIDQTANTDMFVEVSGIIKAYATSLIKISNDLRLLHSQEELILPKVQVGSSIMPGKVNPVILEAVIQVGMKVIANDLLVTQTVAKSTFQINEFLPLLGFSLLESLELLVNISSCFSKHVDKIEANTKIIQQNFENNTTLITAFIPTIGYEKAGEYLQEFEQSEQNNFYQFLKEKLGNKEVEKVLSPHSLVALGYKDN